MTLEKDLFDRRRRRLELLNDFFGNKDNISVLNVRLLSFNTSIKRLQHKCGVLVQHNQLTYFRS
jgi:hypothetical protein